MTVISFILFFNVFKGITVGGAGSHAPLLPN